MNYSVFHKEHEQFRQQVRRFLSERVSPYVEEWGAERRIPKEIWREMGSLGFLGFCYDPAYGGSGADELFRVVLIEEMARANAGGFCLAMTGHNDMSTTYINLLGNHEQKLKWLAPCVSGEKVCAIAVTEPGAGSDVAGMATRAERAGDRYIVNGQKTFITNGYHGDILVTAVKTDLKANPPHKGISLMVIERDTPGVTARKLEKIGAHASDTAEIFFDQVEVPAENLLGMEGQGFYAIMMNFQLERLAIGVLCVETAQYILEKVLDHTRQRIAFGRPLAKLQVVRHKLADMATAIELNRALGYQCAIQYSNGADVTKEISMFKASSSEMVNRVAYDATQLYGGYGFMAEYDVARLYADLRPVTIAGGATEVMKDIIGRLMGL